MAYVFFAPTIDPFSGLFGFKQIYFIKRKGYLDEDNTLIPHSSNFLPLL